MMKAADGARAWPRRVRVTRVEPAREDPDGPRVRAWHAVVAASMVEDSPATEAPAPDRLLDCLTTGASVVWTAAIGDRTVGLALLRPPSTGTVTTGRAQVHVHPAHRLRGVGGRLVTALAAEARARGLHGLIAAVPVAGAGDAFCLRHGMTRVRTLHHLLLSLRDMHPGWLDEMVAAEYPGYRLAETARPAPHGREHAVVGDVLLTITARHDREVVGCTEVVVPQGSGPRATQFDRPPAGGHHAMGLDLWAKAAMLRLLYDRYPHITQVATNVPGHQTTLLAVNRQLGFRLHHRTHEYRLDLTHNQRNR
ncbi:GNAT family N-acetyltransferase [Actinomadura napierensis]|uniref:N-acetyltransferase domain-containing protein n=1 Tax=Actinomadura napierensis TaxID=267854 RepID=A0ABP5JNG5_9ACTN